MTHVPLICVMKISRPLKHLVHSRMVPTQTDHPEEKEALLLLVFSVSLKYEMQMKELHSIGLVVKWLAEQLTSVSFVLPTLQIHYY